MRIGSGPRIPPSATPPRTQAPPPVAKKAAAPAPAITSAPTAPSSGEAHGVIGWFERSLVHLLHKPYPKPADVPHEAARIQRWVGAHDFPDAQKTVLADVKGLGISDVDAWHGSHVVIDGDGGALYEKWKALGASPRSSSHYKDVSAQQYELRFAGREFLFGVNASGDTWFQFEKHPPSDSFWKDPFHFVAHRLDYVAYKATGENVGPLGLSPHRETSGALHVQYRG